MKKEPVQFYYLSITTYFIYSCKNIAHDDDYFLISPLNFHLFTIKLIVKHSKEIEIIYNVNVQITDHQFQIGCFNKKATTLDIAPTLILEIKLHTCSYHYLNLNLTAQNWPNCSCNTIMIWLKDTPSVIKSIAT